MNINAVFKRIGEIKNRIENIKPERLKSFENSFYKRFLSNLKSDKNIISNSLDINSSKLPLLKNSNNSSEFDNSNFGKYYLNNIGFANSNNNISSLIKQASFKYSVPENLIRSVIQAESNYDIHAVSRAGAKGLMQLMPATAKELGVNNVFDPKENIFAGTRYLKGLMKRFDGDLSLSLAAYNAGSKRVSDYGGVPNIRETRNYVKKVIKSYNKINQSSF